MRIFYSIYVKKCWEEEVLQEKNCCFMRIKQL